MSWFSRNIFLSVTLSTVLLYDLRKRLVIKASAFSNSWIYVYSKLYRSHLISFIWLLVCRFLCKKVLNFILFSIIIEKIDRYRYKVMWLMRHAYNYRKQIQPRPIICEPSIIILFEIRNQNTRFNITMQDYRFNQSTTHQSTTYLISRKFKLYCHQYH